MNNLSIEARLTLQIINVFKQLLLLHPNTIYQEGIYNTHIGLDDILIATNCVVLDHETLTIGGYYLSVTEGDVSLHKRDNGGPPVIVFESSSAVPISAL